MLLTLAEGRPEGIAQLKAMDTIDFYYFWKAWRDRQQAIEEAYKK